MSLIDISTELSAAVGSLEFAPPVHTVYNPLDYAWSIHEEYLRRFGSGPKEVVFLGMNPGPFGMTQTGVPFGEIAAVRDWMGLDGAVLKPAEEHPKRPILGLDCPRGEVSGRRLWSWAQGRFGTPENFFERFFVTNYCPLVFLEESGRNRTPDKLPAGERRRLLAVCDEALVRTVKRLEPSWVIGVGNFAEARARDVLSGLDVEIGRILHPSPASPAANRGWAEQAEAQMTALGISLLR